MSTTKLINVQVNRKEIEILINSMSNCIYRDVYQCIDYLRAQRKVTEKSESVHAKLNLEQAQSALTAIVQKPFCEVYELVGKINVQLQDIRNEATKPVVSQSNTLSSEVGSNNEGSATDVSPPQDVNKTVEQTEVVTSVVKKNSQNMIEKNIETAVQTVQPEAIGRPLPEMVLEQITAS